jgi:NAD+ diphosphatase
VPTEIVFSGSPLDRVDFRRRDEPWLTARRVDEATRFLPVWRLSVLVREDEPRLAWATPEVCESMSEGVDPVFLGVQDDVAHFAVDLSNLEDPIEELGLAGAAGFPDLRAVASQLPAGDAAIAAQARHLVDWHSRHRFCPGCGQSTKAENGGYSRVCLSCATEHFPRTDPVVIMLVTRGDRCLLGRQASWPHPFFSALAGFVEGGETLEEAVRREAHEETGIRVGAVRYLASQPWPFPASLMMGCLAEGLNEDIKVDGTEIAEACWFTRAQVKAAFAGQSKELGVPPPMAIAHQLLKAWVEDGETVG